MNISEPYCSLLIDNLSLFFLFVILIVSLPSALFSFGYLKGEYSQNKKILNWLLLALFVLSMAFVVMVSNAIAFLVAWELMSLFSYFLVVFDHKQEKSIQAGTIYIVMTHAATACLIAAFLLLYQYTGSFEIQAIKAAAPLLPVNIKNIVFLLFLVGFGTKAGLVPFHIWLPFAHPQAPSHISSIMSGVMIKMGVYGILRFVIYMLGPGDAWHGILVMALALVSCLAGVIYALMEQDLKKLLAYSSVENIGIILLGTGAYILLNSLGFQAAAVLALAASLFHLLNHAVFKGLLFLGSGAVYKATGTRNMEKMGGLIKSMPWTAAVFLTGSMAISALPPLNGFVSEWLTLRSLFNGALCTAGAARIALVISATLLVLTGGLAAACFVKAFGITFLAKPRSAKSSAAKEVSSSMIAGMVFLAALALLLGLGAGLVMPLITNIALNLGGFTMADLGQISTALNDPFNLGLFLASPFLALIILLTGLLTAFLAFIIYGRTRRTKSFTWDCGYYQLNPRTEYTATAFSKPFRLAFSFFLLPYSKTEKVTDNAYNMKSMKYEVYTTPVFRKYGYMPFLNIIYRIARNMRKLQPGSIHLYIGYIFLALITLILLMDKF